MASRKDFRIDLEQNSGGEIYTVRDRHTGRLLACGWDTYRAALDWVHAQISAQHASR